MLNRNCAEVFIVEIRTRLFMMNTPNSNIRNYIIYKMMRGEGHEFSGYAHEHSRYLKIMILWPMKTCNTKFRMWKCLIGCHLQMNTFSRYHGKNIEQRFDEMMICVFWFDPTGFWTHRLLHHANHYTPDAFTLIFKAELVMIGEKFAIIK